MERRKVIKQGKGTLTMSLPSAWIRRTRLKPGDDLMVEQKARHLIVSPIIMEKEKRVVEVDLKGLSKYFVYTVIENLYIRGEDEIRLVYDSEDAFDAVSEVVRLLIGFEIVEHHRNRCVIKEIAKADKEDFDVLLRRVFILLVAIAEDCVEALEKRNAKELSCMSKRDRNVNILVSYCMRVLSKHEHELLKDSKHLYPLLLLYRLALYQKIGIVENTRLDPAVKKKADALSLQELLNTVMILNYSINTLEQNPHRLLLLFNILTKLP